MHTTSKAYLLLLASYFLASISILCFSTKQTIGLYVINHYYVGSKRLLCKLQTIALYAIDHCFVS